MRTLLVLAAFAVLSASAVAGSAVWTAVPVQPKALPRFVGDSVAWVCAESGCSSVTETGQATAMSECKALARRVGKLSSFSSSKGPFPDSRLTDCNEAAAKAP